MDPSLARRYRLPNGILIATVAAVLVVLGTIQIASDALYAGSAQPGAAPRHVPTALGVRIYKLLDRVAPAGYVESTLAEYELKQGRLAAAERYAIRLPASPVRNDILARIELARGHHQLAFEYFFAAPDIAAVQREIAEIAVRDPQRAYRYEARFKDRLVSLTTHPDAVADAYWRMGGFATQQAYRLPARERRPFLERGLRDYRTALRLAPLNMNYVLSSANQALALGAYRTASRLFEHGIAIDPASADSLAGLGIVALREGRRTSALAYAARARALNPQASELLGLERMLR